MASCITSGPEKTQAKTVQKLQYHGVRPARRYNFLTNEVEVGFLAHLTILKKTKIIGFFTVARKAAEAYDKAVEEHGLTEFMLDNKKTLEIRSKLDDYLDRERAKQE